jgi:hypothetical protein
MKLKISFAVIVIVLWVLAAGCIDIANRNTQNISVPSPTFAPFNPSDPGVNGHENGTNGLKGPLVVSISGYPANPAVFLDNKPVGTVSPTTLLNLMVAEGNHTVMVCVNSVCENENVTTRFGRQSTVDFGERLRRDMEFPNATVRIIEYFKTGDGVSVNVEFINPETSDHTIFLELSVGYSYIDDRSKIKYRDLAKTTTSVFVKAGKRETKRVDVSFTGSGSYYSFDYPQISFFNVI